MPKITPYNVQTSAATLPESRVVREEDFTGPGRGAERLANAGQELAGIISKRAETQEVSDLHVKFSKQMADSTVEYQKQLQDGTLDAQKFTDDLSQKIDKLSSGISTPKGSLYFNQQSAEVRSHFLATTAAGQAQLAGAKAVTDYKDSLNYAGSTLQNDPSAFQTTQKMQLGLVDTYVQNNQLPYDKALEMKQQTNSNLSENAVRGWIKLNPDDAKAQLDQGKWDHYISGDLKKQLYGEADQALRARKVEENLLRQQQQELLKEQQTVTQNDFLARIEKGKLSTKQILESNLDPFGSGSKETFIRLLDQSQEAKVKKITNDPGVYTMLFNRIHSEEDDKIKDENELNKYLGHGLNITGLRQLRGEMQGKGTQAGQDEAALKRQFTNIAKGQLTKSNPLTGFRDPEGDAQYQQFLSGFINEYNAKRQEGKTPEQLLVPSSPDYLGKSISQYKRSNSQITQSLVQSMNNTPAPATNVNAPIPQQPPTAPPPSPRQPGESAAAYLKRIGK